jgi:hypothetical protein
MGIARGVDGSQRRDGTYKSEFEGQSATPYSLPLRRYRRAGRVCNGNLFFGQDHERPYEELCVRRLADRHSWVQFRWLAHPYDSSLAAVPAVCACHHVHTTRRSRTVVSRAESDGRLSPRLGYYRYPDYALRPSSYHLARNESQTKSQWLLPSLTRVTSLILSQRRTQVERTQAKSDYLSVVSIACHRIITESLIRGCAYSRLLTYLVHDLSNLRDPLHV